MSDYQLFKLAAFAEVDGGGNPAGVWVGDALPDMASMQRQAKQIGYSETAFSAPSSGSRRTVRYFSPQMEVPFCGHATIATGVALGRLSGEGTYTLATRAGDVPVTVTFSGGRAQATLVSVTPRHDTAVQTLVSEVLALLGWNEGDLDKTLPPARAYAGAWHLVLAVAQSQRLDALDYDFEALKQLMLREELITVQLVWRASDTLFHSRNPFPVGGVVEDPATGAAAAALGGYLRDSGLVSAPASITLRQGERMGRPSVLRVDIPASGGISVSGTAVDVAT